MSTTRCMQWVTPNRTPARPPQRAGLGRGLPLRFIVQASSCVPAAPGLEVSGADFQAAEIRELLSWPEIAGLAEVMDMRAVIDAHPRMVGILSEALASGKIIEGHARGLTGAALQAYLAAGVSADHEGG